MNGLVCAGTFVRAGLCGHVCAGTFVPFWRPGGIFPTGNHSYLAGAKQKATKQSLWEK